MPFTPAGADEFWEGRIEFEALVRYSEGNRSLDEGDFAAAVIVALDAAGYTLGNGLTIEEPVLSVEADRKEAGTSPTSRRLQMAGGASATFTIQIVAFGQTSVNAISKVVRAADFGDSIAEALVDAGFTSVRGPVEIAPEQDIEFTLKPMPSPPPTGATPPLLDTPGSDVINADTTNGWAAGAGWAVILGILLFLCCLWPFLCFVYAHCKYGAGKERTWARYMFSHSNPTYPFLYIPREEREQLRKQLCNEAIA